MNYDKLRDAINERRKWNMEHMPEPNLVNNGLVQALILIDDIERGDGVTSMGTSVISYSRRKIHEIVNDTSNLILEDHDPFKELLEPLGYLGDVVDVIYPDGVEELCVEESVAKIMIEAMGKAMLENGTFTQEEYEEYLKDPYMEKTEARIIVSDTGAGQQDGEIIPLFGEEG